MDIINNLPKKGPHHSNRDFDAEQLNKCTLCSFKTHTKTSFQRHLMKEHGFKLNNFKTYADNRPHATIGQIANTNGSTSFTGRKLTILKCPSCSKIVQYGKYQKKYYTSHVKNCSAGLLPTCPTCKKSFEKRKNLNQHIKMCGQEKHLICQLCPYKAFEMDRMQKHYIDIHNLICKPVKEPNFDQVLNCTPYILERPIELDVLPTIDDVAGLTNDDPPLRVGKHPVRIRPLFTCKICKHEFLKQKFLNKHMKFLHP